MADGRLKNHHYTGLAERISGQSMEKIAQGKFNLDSEIIGNIKRNHPYDAEAQNRAMMEKWARKVDTHQVMVSILHLCTTFCWIISYSFFINDRISKVKIVKIPFLSIQTRKHSKIMHTFRLH